MHAALPSAQPLRAPPAIPDNPTAEEKIQFYVRLLRSGDEEQIVWAWKEVARAGTPAVARISDALDTAFVKNQFLAENLLNCFVRGLDGSGAILQIQRAAASKDARLRLVAAKSLGHTRSQLAAPTLLDLLNDSFSPVAAAAVASIEKLDREEATRGLLGRFPDGLHPQAQPAAVRALAKLLPEAEARSFLLATLRSKSAALAIYAARSLSPLGPEFWPAVRDRLRTLATVAKDGALVYPIKESLAAARDPDLLKTLPKSLESGNLRASILTIRLLSRYDEPVARKALWTLARKRSGEIRREALHALKEGGDTDASSYAISLLESTESQDRYDAALLIGLFRDRLAVPTAVKVLAKEKDLRIRLKLGHALALIGDPAGSAALVDLLLAETKREPSTAVLAFNAAGSLERFKALSSKALEGLVAASRSDNPAIRLNAAKVLGAKGSSPAAQKALTALLSDPSIDVRRVTVGACLAFPGSTVASLVAASVREPDDRLAKVMARAAQQLVHRWK